jgi:hypothetical protein
MTLSASDTLAASNHGRYYPDRVCMGMACQLATLWQLRYYFTVKMINLIGKG